MEPTRGFDDPDFNIEDVIEESGLSFARTDDPNYKTIDLAVKVLGNALKVSGDSTGHREALRGRGRAKLISSVNTILHRKSEPSEKEHIEKARSKHSFIGSTYHTSKKIGSILRTVEKSMKLVEKSKHADLIKPLLSPELSQLSQGRQLHKVVHRAADVFDTVSDTSSSPILPAERVDYYLALSKKLLQLARVSFDVVVNTLPKMIPRQAGGKTILIPVLPIAHAMKGSVPSYVLEGLKTLESSSQNIDIASMLILFCNMIDLVRQEMIEPHIKDPEEVLRVLEHNFQNEKATEIFDHLKTTMQNDLLTLLEKRQDRSLNDVTRYSILAIQRTANCYELAEAIAEYNQTLKTLIQSGRGYVDARFEQQVEDLENLCVIFASLESQREESYLKELHQFIEKSASIYSPEEVVPKTQFQAKQILDRYFTASEEGVKRIQKISITKRSKIFQQIDGMLADPIKVVMQQSKSVEICFKKIHAEMLSLFKDESEDILAALNEARNFYSLTHFLSNLPLTFFSDEAKKAKLEKTKDLCSKFSQIEKFRETRAHSQLEKMRKSMVKKKVDHEKQLRISGLTAQLSANFQKKSIEDRERLFKKLRLLFL